MEPWRLGLIAIALAWFVQANFAPLAYAFDNYLPWLFAGVALGLPQAVEGRCGLPEPEIAASRPAPSRAEGWVPVG